jgi:VanZ family protein
LNPVLFFGVSKARSFLKYWLPVLIWMVVIFSASGDQGSFQHSSRIIGPLLHWLFPNMQEINVNHVVTFARKCAHLTEYAILAGLFWRALRKPAGFRTLPWLWREAFWAIVFVAFYAMSDEFHQSFVPGREGKVTDVLIDTTGAALGMMFLWILWRILRNPKSAESGETPAAVRE